MGTVLSTNGVSERERLSYWQDLIKRTFGYTEIETTNLSERPFSGTIHLDQLAFLGVAEVTSMRSRVARTPRAAEPTTNSVKAIYQLAGETLIEQGRHSAQLTLGDWVVIDCAQPYMLINTTDYYHHLIVQFPMNELKARLPQAAHAAGCVLPSGKGLVRVTSDFLRATWRELPQITATVRQQLATTLMDLLVKNVLDMYLLEEDNLQPHPRVIDPNVIVDDTGSPITHDIPKTYLSPTNEWYSWRPSPRLDKNVHVLLTMDPTQYPLGIKGLITEKDPDVPVVWTNTNFKMLYMNMGHGDKVFTSPTQNKLFENGILWLLGKN
jgi:hypothetical protein